MDLMIELKELTSGSDDIKALELINTEAIPECERNSLTDLMSTGATITGVYSDSEPVGFLVTRTLDNILYLAYLAVRSDLRSQGLGGISLKKLLEKHTGMQVVVEFEAPDPALSADDIKSRRKNFYLRNGFSETGWFTFYDETEFEIACANRQFEIDDFGRFVEHLSSIISDHIPAPYQKSSML